MDEAYSSLVTAASENDLDVKWHFRRLDPSEADIYLDALFGPMYFKYERFQKERTCQTRFSDYMMVSLFLLLNAVLQMAIAFKIDQVALRTYGEVGHALFNGACWRVSAAQQFVGLLYPEDFKDSSDFDCTQPLLTLSMLPDKLDLNKDGYWSVDEAYKMSKELHDRGSRMGANLTENLMHMAKYDVKHRAGSKSDLSKHQLDMDFFQHFRGKIEMCLPVDPKLCGNLEADGKLAKMLPERDDGQERVEECRENFGSFCTKLFGNDYEWIHYATSELCGHSKFERKSGINVAVYEAVSTYKGEPDSILGTTFVSFLVLLLFIWGMLMIKEFLYIYNFMYVVWYMPSTTDDDENFASVVDGKILVRKMPSMHKIFGLVCVALPRLVIAVVILTVGASFLSATNNLQDLVLNSTALCFLIEVDNMIHASFLGENFEKHVTDQCDAIKVPSSSSGTWQPYLFLAVALFTTAGWTGWSYFNRRGLAAIGTGMECLCHFAGDCYASSFVSTS